MFTNIVSTQQHEFHFRKVQALCNMRRFYTVSLQPTLFGEWSLIRRWGRVGTRGRSLLNTYESEVRARIALDQAVGKRRKRGYVEML